MKKITFISCVLMLALIAFAPAARAQSGAKKGPDPATVRDADAEKDSLHNLDVARQYFKLRKAYRAALSRCEEIIAANPAFSRLDETLYIAGMSSLFLSEKKGKQAPSADASTDKLREDARTYLSQLVEHFPDSSFRKDAEARLRELGGPKETKQ